MIKNVEPISSTDFNKGLVTRSDFLKGDINASPNTMDVQWNFDASMRKRFGATSINAIGIGSTAPVGWTMDSNGSLSVALNSYWKMEEPSLTRFNQIGNLNLTDAKNSVPSIAGIRGQAASYAFANSCMLYSKPNSSLSIATGNFSLSTWVYLDTFSQVLPSTIISKAGSGLFEYGLYVGLGTAGSGFVFYVSSNGQPNAEKFIFADSFGLINTATWYNVVAWHSNNSHIGISVNLSANTAPFTQGTQMTSANFIIGASDTAGGILQTLGRIDETGLWGKILSTTDRINLYGGGTGNTYTGAGNTGFAWACFDFGAFSMRWLTVSAGTGIYASSNLGATFVVIATNRSQNYQYLDRSKNVLIATSDSYDLPLYWAGSAGTFAATLAPNSAPAAKFSVNYQGFCILLNFMDSNGTVRNRGFAYADENLQLTDAWNNSFDLPSTSDDEITGSFILYKFLYVSTRYKIYRVAFVGGNPDWSYLKVKDWGFVPRTIRIVSLRGGGQYAVGLDWDRRIRLFDGFDDQFISDNIENDNMMCDFAMSKVSYAGSGLVISNAELNAINQEYRLNVAIGPSSTQTTHSIILNARNLAFYPYSNQQWQTMCMAESNNQRHLMAFDRSGFCYILDSGNLDGVTPISEVYDCPPLFSKIPEVVSKGHQLNFFFAPLSCGTIYYQSRVDLSNKWGTQVPLSNSKGDTQITGTENAIKVLRTVDVKETYNTYQFRITTSSNSINPYMNLLSNGDFESWTAGVNTVPDNWLILGTGGAVARESTIVYSGQYSAKLTRNGFDTLLFQEFFRTRGLQYWKGRSATFNCWVYATLPNRARIVLSDNVNNTYSPYHPGNSTWQFMSVTQTMDNSSTDIAAACAVDTGDTSAYFDNAVVLDNSSLAGGTANPWHLDRLDFLQQGFGVGIGN